MVAQITFNNVYKRNQSWEIYLFIRRKVQNLQSHTIFCNLFTFTSFDGAYPCALNVTRPYRKVHRCSVSRVCFWAPSDLLRKTKYWRQTVYPRNKSFVSIILKFLLHVGFFMPSLLTVQEMTCHSKGKLYFLYVVFKC